MKGHFEKAGLPPCRVLREFRVEDGAEVKVGDKVSVELFAPGDKITVIGHQQGQGLPGRREAPPLPRRRRHPRLDVPPRAGLDRRLGLSLARAQGHAGGRAHGLRPGHRAQRQGGAGGRREQHPGRARARCPARAAATWSSGRRAMAEKKTWPRRRPRPKAAKSDAKPRPRRRRLARRRPLRPEGRTEAKAEKPQAAADLSKAERGERREQEGPRDRRCRPDVFGVRVNKHLLYEAVKQYRAGGRRGTHMTKNRALVSGTGKKPWRQKGTGRARVGEARNPLWRHGGTVFGPTPRDYSYDMPKKARAAALRSALTQRAERGRPPGRRGASRSRRRRRRC